MITYKEYPGLKRVNQIAVFSYIADLLLFILFMFVLNHFEAAFFSVFAVMIYPIYAFMKYSLSLDKSKQKGILTPVLWISLMTINSLFTVFASCMLIFNLLGCEVGFIQHMFKFLGIV